MSTAIFAHASGSPSPRSRPVNRPSQEPEPSPVPAELDHAWSQIQAELRRAVTDSTFHIWLEPLRPLALEGDTLVVAAPDEIRSWVADRFARVLQSCTAAVLGPEVTVLVSDGKVQRPSGTGLPPRADVPTIDLNP